MTRQVRLREVLASVEGLALLRRLYEGSDEEAAARIAELRHIVCEDGDALLGDGVPMREVSSRAGYTEWARAYEALPSKRRAMQHIPEATRLAYEGLPAVLVWGLTRA